MPDTRFYCTHFNRNYLLKGIALYRSLERYGGEFFLHIVCLDNTTYKLLQKLHLNRARLIPPEDFEDPELLRVKPTRTVAEYCWTCTPSVPLYVLDHNPEITLLTYLDADLFFFSSPEPIFKEFGDSSILLIEHRFAPRYSEYEVNGRFNVGWLSFRRDENGMAALRWWREKCNEWCFYRLEGDRMGDQKYLDTWPTLFKGVHVLNYVGANVAPYNFSRYTIVRRNDVLHIDDVPLIFYHFHGFRHFADGKFAPMADMYLQDAQVPREVYVPYQMANEEALLLVRTLDPSFIYGLEPVPGIVAPKAVASRVYWTVPEWCRAAVRAIVPKPVRERVLRVLGMEDHRGISP